MLPFGINEYYLFAAMAIFSSIRLSYLAHSPSPTSRAIFCVRSRFFQPNRWSVRCRPFIHNKFSLFSSIAFYCGSPEKISVWLQGHRRQFVNGRHRPHTHKPSTIGDIHLFLSSRLSTIHNLNIRTASTTCKYE